jgi:hypothetical protein
MAVPSSGALTLLGIAQERYYSTYGTGSITGPIVYEDLINGGNTGGSGMSYPALNTASSSVPTTTTPWPMDEWYDYDQSAGCTAVTLGYGSTATIACAANGATYYTPDITDIFNNYLYSNSTCTTYAATGTYAVLLQGGGGTRGSWHSTNLTWTRMGTCK